MPSPYKQNCPCPFPVSAISRAPGKDRFRGSCRQYSKAIWTRGLRNLFSKCFHIIESLFAKRRDLCKSRIPGLEICRIQKNDYERSYFFLPGAGKTVPDFVQPVWKIGPHSLPSPCIYFPESRRPLSLFPVSANRAPGMQKSQTADPVA